MEPDFILDCAKQGQRGLSKLAANLFQDQIIYDHAGKQWYTWTGKKWRKDACGNVEVMVSSKLLKQLLAVRSWCYANGKADKDAMFTITEAEKIIFNESTYKNVIKRLLRQPGLKLVGDEWDADPWLLGCENGVIDLRTAEFREATPRDYIRKICPVEWTGLETQAPRFEQFMSEIFAGDTELIHFAYRLLGYSLTGSTRDHCLPILYGEDGRNGKSVLLRVLKEVLGDYVGSIPSEVLLSGSANPSAATPYTMMLHGLRLAHCSETNEGFVINAGVVKSLTGGDELSGRPLYGNVVSFKPTHKVMLISNFKPHINSDDQAIWERVTLIHFTQRFVDNPTEPNEHKRDPDLIDELTSEKSGILARLVQASRAWQTAGLKIPQSIQIATEVYRSDEDTLSDFFNEVCLVHEDLSIQASQLYKTYVDWSKGNNLKPMSSAAFGSRAKKRYEFKRTNKASFYYGMSVNPAVAMSYDKSR